MNISINLPPEVLDDEADGTLLMTPQQLSFNRLMEWRVMLRILQAICTAFGYSLEFDPSANGTDASCAIFADTVCADNDANAWLQNPLFDSLTEQETTVQERKGKGYENWH